MQSSDAIPPDYSFDDVVSDKSNINSAFDFDQMFESLHANFDLVPPTDFSGVVKRKGRLFRTWKYRYFRLSMGCVKSYRNELESADKGRFLGRPVVLFRYQIQVTEGCKIHLYRPSTIENNYRTLIFMVKSSDDLETWRTAIAKHIDFMDNYYKLYVTTMCQVSKRNESITEDTFLDYCLFMSSKNDSVVSSVIKDDFQANTDIETSDVDAIDGPQPMPTIVLSNEANNMTGSVEAVHALEPVGITNRYRSDISIYANTHLAPILETVVAKSKTGGSSVIHEPAEHMGYIKKQGHFFKTWKVRYFHLHQGLLSYFHAVTDFSYPDRALAPPLHLLQYEIVPMSGNKLMLSPMKQLAHRNGVDASTTSLLLEFVDTQTTTEWTRALQDHIRYANEMHGIVVKKRASDVGQVSSVTTSVVTTQDATAHPDNHSDTDQEDIAFSLLTSVQSLETIKQHREQRGLLHSSSLEYFAVPFEESDSPQALVDSANGTYTNAAPQEAVSHSSLTSSDTVGGDNKGPVSSNQISSVPSRHALSHLVHLVEHPPKKSGFIRKEGHFFKTWKRRYFVLQDGILSYFESEKSFDHALGETWDLHKCSLTATATTRLQITSGITKKTLQLEFDSSNDLQDWTASLQQHGNFRNEHLNG